MAILYKMLGQLEPTLNDFTNVLYLLITIQQNWLHWYICNVQLNVNNINITLIQIQGNVIDQTKVNRWSTTVESKIQTSTLKTPRSITKSTTTSQTLHFKYRPAFNMSMSGVDLTVPQDLWQRLELTEFVSASSIKENELIFVIGASRNHFQESLDAIASVQYWFPNTTILYYDIDKNKLTAAQITMVSRVNNLFSN